MARRFCEPPTKLLRPRLDVSEDLLLLFGRYTAKQQLAKGFGCRPEISVNQVKATRPPKSGDPTNMSLTNLGPKPRSWLLATM